MAKQFEESKDEPPNDNGSKPSIIPGLETINVRDEHNQVISCYVERTLEVDTNQYALLLPIDIPVEIFAFSSDSDGNESLSDLEDEILDSVFLTARAVLAEQDLMLEQTALTWTAKGELPAVTDEDIVTLDLSDEDEALQTEDFQLLATFFHDDNEYAIYTPLDPLLIFVRMSPDGIPSLLEPDEFELIRPQIEDLLFDDL